MKTHPPESPRLSVWCANSPSPRGVFVLVAFLVLGALSASPVLFAQATATRRDGKTSGAEAEGATELSVLIDRFSSDRDALERLYDISTSASRAGRLRDLASEYLERIERESFDALDSDAKVDWILFRDHLESFRDELAREARLADEIESLIPFRAEIVLLEEGRRRRQTQEARDSSQAVAAITREIDAARKTLELASEKARTGAGDTEASSESTTEESSAARLAPPGPVLAERAARATDELRHALGDWYSFYAGYDPVFTWWLEQPYGRADRALGDYSNFLRERFVGQTDGEDAPLVGDPVGREALVRALAVEHIPYTPEELIEIGRRELAWCEEEMRRVSTELGFDGDWKRALEHVSSKFVEPGEQPRLIRDLAEEAVNFLEERELVTIPELCKETWRMEMMSPERQKVNPYFTGGEVISISYPTDSMSHEEKLMSLRGNNVHFCRATVHHEVIPGHHLQGFMARRYRPYRRLFRTPFLVEGWALYWELRLWDLGFPRSPEDRVGMLFWRSHRAARIIFSLGFHLGTMTPLECVDLLVERIGHEPRNATAEVRRSIQGGYEPLYQAAYLLGGLQLKGLHDELVVSGRMSEREFHDAVLRENAIPVALIRARLGGGGLRRDGPPEWRFYPGLERVAAAATDAGSKLSSGGTRTDAGTAKNGAAATEEDDVDDDGEDGGEDGESSSARRSPPRVYRTRIDPEWSSDGSRFWYRVETGPRTFEYIFVDAERGVREALFDRERVARFLTRELSRDVDASDLPISRIEIRDSGATVRFQAGGRVFTLDRSTQEIVASEDSGDASGEIEGLAPIAEPHPSRDRGEETQITFVNETGGPVELIWIDRDGEEVSYGTIARGEERSQHTFAGHVWVARSADRRFVLAFEASGRPERAVVRAGRDRENGSGRDGAGRFRGRARGRFRVGAGGTTAAARDADAAVPSPDGRLEAFVRDDNLWVRESGGGGADELSWDGNPGDSYHRDVLRDRAIGLRYDAPDAPPTLPEVRWSPDSKRLVAIRTRAAPERRVHILDVAPDDRLEPELESYPYFKPGDEIPLSRPVLFDVEAWREIPIEGDLFPNPWSISQIRWAQDGSRFTFVYNQRGHQILRVIAVDAETGAARAIVDEQSKTFIDYAGKFFYELLDESSEIVWMSERDGWNHLYLYDATTGEVKNQITKGEWVVRGVDRVDRERRQIWFRAGGILPDQDPYHVHFARVDFDGSHLVVLTQGDGTHSIDFSPDRRFFIDTWSRVDRPPVHELRRSDDGSLVCPLDEGDASDLLAAGLRFPERFVAKGRDGETDIWGYIVRPREFDPAERYPVIEQIYAGPHSAHVPKSFRERSSESALADHGFVVVRIDGMGTSLRSKRFHDVCWKNIGDAGFPDRIAWMRAAAAERPWMDIDRVGIFGGSAGGQNALRALLAFGDFYDAAFSDSGCHDNRMDKIWWNELWMGWPVGPHYDEQSNVTQAHRLEGKLLLAVGGMDRNVDPASTLQVVDALIEADKDFELLYVPRAGHGAGGSRYGRRKMVDFFERSLGDPRPAGGEVAGGAAVLEGAAR